LFHGHLHPLSQTNGWKRFLGLLWKRDWVVYTKPPFGGAQQVLKYLARYTHRVAISNQRLLSLRDGKVRFRWKDSKQGNRQRTCTLDPVQFLRRFLLHVLPKGFMRIRYYGFLANRHRREKIALCRKLLGLAEKPSIGLPEAGDEEATARTDNYRSILCPLCRKDHMINVETIPRDPTALHNLASFLNYDTG
jgi:hypothetical protein